MATQHEREIRSIKGKVEIRQEGDAVLFSGYAALNNSWSEDLGGFRERMAPGAFKNVLAASPDCEFLVDHEGLPLARTISGTLKLTEDEVGLRYETSLDMANPDAQRLVSMVKRGDVQGSSFAFATGADHWERTVDGETRTITEVAELYDVSAVVHPAYPATSVALRSREMAKRGLFPDVALAKIRLAQQ